MRRWVSLLGSGAALVAMLSSCSGTVSAGPDGWAAVSGKSGSWTLGSGTIQQSYRVVSAPFNGSLAALGARETIAVVLGNHGTRMRSTMPFAPCPGAAGVATFTAGTRIIEAAYAIRDGRGITIRYVRPANVSESAVVQAAMQRTLCVAPA